MMEKKVIFGRLRHRIAIDNKEVGGGIWGVSPQKFDFIKW
jgi:hypothetical protein